MPLNCGNHLPNIIKFIHTCTCTCTITVLPLTIVYFVSEEHCTSNVHVHVLHSITP